MTWFAFLNLSGMVTKPLNLSQCLFLCLLFVHAIASHFSDQLSERTHICRWRWNQMLLSLLSQSVSDKVIGWAVLVLVCERKVLALITILHGIMSHRNFSSSSINPSKNLGFIQAAKEFFERFKDCANANVMLGKESTANKQWMRRKCFYTERKSFILLYFYSKNH